MLEFLLNPLRSLSSLPQWPLLVSTWQLPKVSFEPSLPSLCVPDVPVHFLHSISAWMPPRHVVASCPKLDSIFYPQASPSLSSVTLSEWQLPVHALPAEWPRCFGDPSLVLLPGFLILLKQNVEFLSTVSTFPASHHITFLFISILASRRPLWFLTFIEE